MSVMDKPFDRDYDASERTFDDCSQTEMFDPRVTPLIDNEIIMLGVYPNLLTKRLH